MNLKPTSSSKVEDAVEAMRFSILMGDEVEQRRRFIERMHLVQNLEFRGPRRMLIVGLTGGLRAGSRRSTVLEGGGLTH